MKEPENHAHRNRHLERGFTLVEMLLVLVILGTLAAIVYPSIINQGVKAKNTSTRLQISSLQMALAQYALDNDHFPVALTDLVHRPNNARNWHLYLEKKVVPTDAWGLDFVYRCPGQENPESYDIVSAGPDGVLGTEDDIMNWDPGTKVAVGQ